MRVVVQLKATSQPLEYNAINTYQKESLFCIYTYDGLVYKFPIENIWRIVEQYGDHGTNIKETKDGIYIEK